MFYNDFTKEIAQCKKDIGKVKKRLIARTGKVGLWENFGQKELRKLNDEYFQYVYECKEIRDLLWAFDEWAIVLLHEMGYLD